MRTTLPELAYIAKNIKYFIGLRSGIMDFLSCTEAELLCISPLYYFSCDLKTVYEKNNAHTIYFAGLNVKQISDEINQVIQKHSGGLVNYDIDFKLSVSHKYIDSKDIACSEEDVFMAVLNYINNL